MPNAQNKMPIRTRRRGKTELGQERELPGAATKHLLKMQATTMRRGGN